MWAGNGPRGWAGAVRWIGPGGARFVLRSGAGPVGWRQAGFGGWVGW